MSMDLLTSIVLAVCATNVLLCLGAALSHANDAFKNEEAPDCALRPVDKTRMLAR